jgi:hypothetical protein
MQAAKTMWRRRGGGQHSEPFLYQQITKMAREGWEIAK